MFSLTKRLKVKKASPLPCTLEGTMRKGEVNRRRGRYCKEEEEANGGIVKWKGKKEWKN
jgi:hypothetical protein